MHYFDKEFFTLKSPPVCKRNFKSLGLAVNGENNFLFMFYEMQGYFVDPLPTPNSHHFFLLAATGKVVFWI